ncbi:hypothetical protein HanPI659440_Chr05g0204191 [Helianthus annuus]|nr:hypothetical protein HanPI659440_Chr05g0204191 [Helianthus annuus]
MRSTKKYGRLIKVGNQITNQILPCVDDFTSNPFCPLMHILAPHI